MAAAAIDGTSGPHGDLPHARGGAGIHEDRDVYRDDEQQQADPELEAAHRQLHLRPVDTDEGVRVGHDAGPSLAVRLRRGSGHPIADRGHFRLRLFQRQSVGQPSEDA